jgi:uncharacterized protein (UPF0332 family)
MFGAARAALLISDAPVEPHIGKTHSGLINAFSNYLVKNGPLAPEMGRLLNRAEEVRLVADHSGDPVEINDAELVVKDAEIFVRAIQTVFFTKGGA